MLQKIKFTVFSAVFLLALAASALLALNKLSGVPSPKVNASLSEEELLRMDPLSICTGEDGYPGILCIQDYALKRHGQAEKNDVMEWRLVFPGHCHTGSGFLHVSSLPRGFVAVYKDNLGDYPMVLFDEAGQRQSLVVRSPFLSDRGIVRGEKTLLAWGGNWRLIDFPIAYLYDFKLNLLRAIPYKGNSLDSIFTKINNKGMYIIDYYDEKFISYLGAVGEDGTILWSTEYEKIFGKEKLMGTSLTSTREAIFILSRNEQGLVLLRLNPKGELTRKSAIPGTKNIYIASDEQTFFALNDDTLIVAAYKEDAEGKNFYFITVNTRTFKSKIHELPDLKDSYVYSARKSEDKEIVLVTKDGIRIMDDKLRIKYILNRDVNAKNRITDALTLPSGDFIVAGDYHEDSFHPKAFVGRINRSAFTPVLGDAAAPIGK